MSTGRTDSARENRKIGRKHPLKAKRPFEFHIVYCARHQTTSNDVSCPPGAGHCIRYCGSEVAEARLGRRSRPYLTLSETHSSCIEAPCGGSAAVGVGLSQCNVNSVDRKDIDTVDVSSAKRVDDGRVLDKRKVLGVPKHDDIQSCGSWVSAAPLKATSLMVLRRETYIPFNPFGANQEEAAKSTLYSRSGEAFVVLSPMDPNMKHLCQDGSELPEYRWAYRRWLFSRFDEGIEVDGTGFMEVSPEPVAQHIAGTMAWYTEGKASQRTSQPVAVEEGIALVPGTVVESCAGYGGNTIQLAKRFTHVCAVDIDASRIRKAQKNAEIYQIPEGRIEWVTASFETWLGAAEGFQKVINKLSVSEENGSWTDGDRNTERGAPIKEPAAVIHSTNQCNNRVSDEASKDSLSHAAVADDGGEDLDERNCGIARTVTADEYRGDNTLGSGGNSTLRKLQNKHALWFFMAPPWGGESYKELENFSLGIFYSHVISASRCCRNVCLYLPANQDIRELVQLSGELADCALLIVESISIGLTKTTKYLAAYFLDEETALLTYPTLHTAVAQCACLELGENVRFMSRSFEFLCKELGVHKFQRCLQEAIRLYAAGGLEKNSTPGVARTFGGVFFAEVKERFPKAYKNLNKFRKREAAQVPQHRGSLKRPCEEKTP